MLTSSCKAKGQKLSKAVKELILEHFPDLSDGDINVVPSGVTGPDLWLSPKAQEKLWLVIECKMQESLSIWKAFEQAKSHVVENGKPQIPTLFYSRNRSEIMVSLRARDFLKMIS